MLMLAVVVLFIIIYLLRENIYVLRADGESARGLGNLLYGIPLLLFSVSAACIAGYSAGAKTGGEKRYKACFTAYQIVYGIIIACLISLFLRYNLEGVYHIVLLALVASIVMFGVTTYFKMISWRAPDMKENN